MFDTKLASKIYVQYLKSSCQKSLDILRVVGHTDWRADRTVLLRLYRALVRSKLDYGCIVYGSARRLVLKQLDQIHHQGLRIALEAFRTSLAQSLYVEAYEPYLTSRRLNLSLNYVLKLKSLPENQAYKYVFEPENTQLFEESESKILLLDMRIVPHLEKSKINLNLIDDAPSLDIGHSMLSAPTVRLDLTKFKKNTTNPERTNSFIHSLLLNILCVKKGFTDGSKTGRSRCGGCLHQTFTENIYLLASRRQFHIYCWVAGYSFGPTSYLYRDQMLWPRNLYKKKKFLTDFRTVCWVRLVSTSRVILQNISANPVRFCGWEILRINKNLIRRLIEVGSEFAGQSIGLLGKNGPFWEAHLN